MKFWLGLGFILVGIALGLWLGIWVCFIGGIVQLINAVKIDPINAIGIAWGLLRIIIAGAVGWLSFIFLGGIGASLIKNS